jgi:hypothetical protein
MYLCTHRYVQRSSEDDSIQRLCNDISKLVWYTTYIKVGMNVFDTEKRTLAELLIDPRLLVV